MKKLSKEEADRLKASKSGKKHPANVFIESLKVGESCYISREDFKWKKRTPEVFCRRIAKRTNRQFICTVLS